MLPRLLLCASVASLATLASAAPRRPARPAPVASFDVCTTLVQGYFTYNETDPNCDDMGGFTCKTYQAVLAGSRYAYDCRQIRGNSSYLYGGVPNASLPSPVAMVDYAFQSLFPQTFNGRSFGPFYGSFRISALDQSLGSVSGVGPVNMYQMAQDQTLITDMNIESTSGAIGAAKPVRISLSMDGFSFDYMEDYKPLVVDSADYENDGDGPQVSLIMLPVRARIVYTTRGPPLVPSLRVGSLKVLGAEHVPEGLIAKWLKKRERAGGRRANVEA